MIRWLKSLLWPCKHGVNMHPDGIITHKSLRVSSTGTGNVYRLSIWCRRCNTLVVRFEGTIDERSIDERLSEEAAQIIETALADPIVSGVWYGPKGRNWMADFDKPLE